MHRYAWFSLVISWLFILTAPGTAEQLAIDALQVQAKIASGGDFMAYGFDSVWMMSGPEELVRINATDNSILKIKVAGAIGSFRGIAVGEDGVWIPDTSSKKIYKLDPRSNDVTLIIPVDFFDSEGSIAVDDGAVWIVASGEKFQTVLARFNSKSGAAEAMIPLPRGSIAAVAGYGSIWVTNNEKHELYRIDPKTNSVVSTIALHERPRFLASGEDAVWVLNQSDGTVQKVDPETGKIVATIETVPGEQRGGDVFVGGGYVWVTLHGFPVVQIDPRSNTTKRTYKGSGMGDAIRYGANSLWVSGGKIFRIKPPN